MKQQDEPATKKDLEKVEGRLQNVEHGLQKVENKLQEVEETLSTKIDTNAAKIDTNSEILSRLTSLVLENQSEIKNMVTRNEFNRRMDEIITGQDKMVQLFMNLNQERVATTVHIDRIERDVQENRSKIQELEAKAAR